MRVFAIMEKKLNILFVVNEIFPDACGGVHTYIYELARGLARRGHGIHILTKKVKENSLERENINGINIHRYEAKNRGFAFLCQLSSILSVHKAFIKLMHTYDFDLLSLNSPHATLGIDLSKTAKSIPRIYTFYALLTQEEIYDASRKKYNWHQWRKYIKPFWFSLYLFLLKQLERKAIKSAGKIISLSGFTSQCLMKVHNIAAEKIAQIPAGVDVEKFKPPADKISVRKTLGLPEDKTILFTLRRLVPRMGLENLLRAMPVVLKEVPNALLVMGGKGPLYTDLKNLIDELRLSDRIFLKGFISDENLPLYYQACDLFILPSIALEGFGMVTLESLACGVPVLATPVGGTIEILNKLDRKLLFADISVQSIASLIIEYLTDEQKYLEIQKKCRQFVIDNYSWDMVIEQLEELFVRTSESKKSTNCREFETNVHE